MKRLFILLLLLVSAPLGIAQQAKDFYQGITAMPCPGTNVVSGTPPEWHVERINGHVVLCTKVDGNNATSHAMWLLAVHQVVGDTHTEANHVPQSLNTTTTAKYASPLRDVRDVRFQLMKTWDFNASGVGSVNATASQVLTANKMPFFDGEGTDTAANGFQHCINGAADGGGAQCKNLWNLTTAAYDAGTNHNIVDAYDPAYATFENAEFAASASLPTWKTSGFFIGYIFYDPDNCSGCISAATTAAQAADVNHGGTYPAHPWDTDQAGSSWSSPAIRIAASAPHQANNPRNSDHCFTDQVNYTKAQFAMFLQTRYGTLAALNTAWGHLYDSFGTDGVQVTGATTSGSGTGPYTVTLTGTVDKYSVAVLVSGSCIGGDSRGDGTFRGGTIVNGSSTINYGTGAVSITFSGTPAAAPTINYWHGGWPNVGNGVLDEGGTNIGNGDTTGVPAATTAQIRNQVTDLEDFLTPFGNKFISVPKAAYQAVFTNASLTPKLFLNTAGTALRDPGRCGLLKGMAQAADINGIQISNGADQADYVSKCMNDKPYVIWESVLAQNDWDFYNCPGGTGCGGPTNWPPVPTYNYTNQNTRGAGYASDVAKYWGQCNLTTLNCNAIGIGYWGYYSFSFTEYENWGLCSWRDNCYNGTDNVTSSVTCAAPLQAYTCGSEQSGWSAYGNFLGPVTTANQQIDSNVANLNNAIPIPPPPPGPGLPSFIITSASKCKTMKPSDELCKGYNDLSNLLGNCIVCGL